MWRRKGRLGLILNGDIETLWGQCQSKVGIEATNQLLGKVNVNEDTRAEGTAGSLHSVRALLQKGRF
jgi:hypothetical protein